MRTNEKSMTTTLLLTALAVGLMLLPTQAWADGPGPKPDDYWKTDGGGLSGILGVEQTYGPTEDWNWDSSNEVYNNVWSTKIHFNNPYGRGDTEYATFAPRLRTKADGSRDWHDWDTLVKYKLNTAGTQWVAKDCLRDTVGYGGGSTSFKSYWTLVGTGYINGGSYSPGSGTGSATPHLRLTDENLAGAHVEEWDDDGPTLSVFKVGVSATDMSTLMEDHGASYKEASVTPTVLELSGTDTDEFEKSLQWTAVGPSGMAGYASWWATIDSSGGLDYYDWGFGYNIPDWSDIFDFSIAVASPQIPKPVSWAIGVVKPLLWGGVAGECGLKSEASISDQRQDIDRVPSIVSPVICWVWWVRWSRPW